MSKRVLTVLLAVMMAVGIYTAVASAGVEGDFTFDFGLEPVATQTPSQVSEFTLNFEGILNLDVTLSGLTISNYITFGIAGLETYVAGLSTTLGALDLTDEFWFSVLYGGIKPDYRIKNYLEFVKKRVEATITLGGLTFDNLALFEDVSFSYPADKKYTVTIPYEFDANGDGTKTNYVGPVSWTWLVPGTSVTPGTTICTVSATYGDGTAVLGRIYATSFFDVAYAVAPAATAPVVATKTNGSWTVTIRHISNGTYRFGDIIKFSGTTVSGIGVEAITGISADPQVPNAIKKYSAADAVIPYKEHSKVELFNVTADNANYNLAYYPVSGSIKVWAYKAGVWTLLTKTTDWTLLNLYQIHDVSGWATAGYTRVKIAYRYLGKMDQYFDFVVEKINLTGIAIGPLTLNDYIEFRPTQPIKNTIEITATMMGFDIDIALYTTDITAIGSFSSVSASAALGDYFTITWDDANANFTMDAGDSIEVVSSIPIQTATFSNDITIEPTVGITAAEFGMSVPLPVGTFTGSVTYGGSPLAWDYFNFELDTTVGGLDLTLSSKFGVSGLDNAHLTITIPFTA